MDSNLLRIFSVIVSVIIFFIFPLYITYEKKDDISYFLALRTTYDFVENVTKNGYLSTDMYDKYVNDLATTGNAYDIEIEYRKKRYDPVLYQYNNNEDKDVIKKFDYLIYGPSKDGSGYNPARKELVINRGTPIPNVVLSTEENIEVYTKAQILEVIGREDALNYFDMSISDYTKPDLTINKIGQLPTIYDINNQELIQYTDSTNEKVLRTFDYKKYKNTPDYNPSTKQLKIGTTTYDNVVLNIPDEEAKYKSVFPMNIGDEFVVKIKNQNITLATVLFNTLTLGLNSGNTTRVYVEYGGVIKNETYKQF